MGEHIALDLGNGLTATVDVDVLAAALEKREAERRAARPPPDLNIYVDKYGVSLTRELDFGRGVSEP